MATEKFQYLAGTLIPGTKYRVIRLLGAGGMGTVYEVEDTTIDKRYVLKTLHANLSSRKDLVDRMQREAKALAKLEHRNIVQVITADVTGDSLKLPYFVMQKLHGHTLRTVLDHKGKLEIDAAVRLTIDLLNALYHAHENGIIHRDVKPENIFLHRDPDGLTVPKLLDFGVMATTESVTITGHRFIGTLRYASPEQLMGEKVSPQTDLYAAALVLYEALAGRGPFEEEGDAMKVARAHIEKVPPLLSMYRQVPPSLERMVMRSLSKTPAERHPDAFTFAAELHRFLRELRGSLPPDQATASTVSDVMQLPAAAALGEAVRGAAQPAPRAAAGKISSGSAPTRPDAPIAGATLPASDPITKPLRAVGAGNTLIGTPAPDGPEPAPAAAPSAAAAFPRGATVAQDPPTMTLGEERPALRAVVAQEAAQRDAAARGVPYVDRNAPTGTLAPLSNVRDGETELIDSMIGEGLAHAGTPPARNVKRASIPAVDGDAASRAPADDASGSAASAQAKHATSAGGSSHTVSAAGPPARSGGTRVFALAMGAVIAVALAGAAALVYASRLPPRTEAQATKPAETPVTATATAAPLPSAAPVIASATPSASASSAAEAAPSVSAAPPPARAEAAPRPKPKTSTSAPVETSAGSAARATSTSTSTSTPPLRRKLPGSGL